MSVLDDHYYATGYSTDNDPYVYENGVLINLYGIQDTASLNEIESTYSALNLRELSLNPPEPRFTQQYHIALHHLIFKEVYPWAGELRVVDICKASTTFMENEKIADSLEQLFSRLNAVNDCKGMSHAEFSDFMGIFLSQLNFIHPFREGNGRTQRFLISEIARNADFYMDWNTVSPETMNNACIDGIAGQYRKAQRLILLNSRPETLLGN